MATDLSKAELHRLWAELEAALNGLLNDLQSTLDAEIVRDSRHYLEHREYGLALETLYYGARASKHALTREQDDKCQDLARRMAITLAA
jgi:hypothetical protein